MENPPNNVSKLNISVVITTYNRSEMLSRMLDSVLRQDSRGRFIYEVVVVDDGSTDRTGDVVRAVSQRSSCVPVKYVYQRGSGVAAARNRGIREASGDWIAFFDDDQWAEPSWLAQMYKVATEKKADCVAGALELELPCSASVPLSPFCLDLLGESRPGESPAKYPEDSVPGTGNVMVRRSVFERAGMFDDGLQHGGSDIDFFWRARKKGAVIWSAPAALGHHVIPECRLRQDYFRYLARRCGLGAALTRFRHRGTRTWLRFLAQTLVRSFARDLWLWLAARLVGDKAQALDRKCRLWFAAGYVRGCLSLLGLTGVTHDRFLASVHFRTRGREAESAKGAAQYGRVRY